jgi:CxxC motif-containing protein (DUF1111 family)
MISPINRRVNPSPQLRWGKGHLFAPAQHLEPAVLFRHAGLIGFGLRVHHFRVEDVTQLGFERCTLPRVCRDGAKVGQFLGIGFKVEELRRRANIVDVLMPQIAQHVERVGAVGVFGWKDQHSSLLSFIGDAYLNEMGITNRLKPVDETTIGKVTADPEDVPDNLGLADIDHFAQFIRGTKAPPPDAELAASADAQAGQELFRKIGCDACHVPTITTAPPGTPINGGTFAIPAALGNKIIHPYGDFLLHDIKTGDGIVQAGPQDTANKLRTAPLWGLRMRPRFMHDHQSLTLENAIERHKGEAEDVADRFFDLTETQQQLITFLNSL